MVISIIDAFSFIGNKNYHLDFRILIGKILENKKNNMMCIYCRV